MRGLGRRGGVFGRGWRFGLCQAGRGHGQEEESFHFVRYQSSAAAAAIAQKREGRLHNRVGGPWAPNPGWLLGAPRGNFCAGLKLIVVHYHLRAGGVRRVLELALPPLVKRLQITALVLLTGEAPERLWLDKLCAALGPIPVKMKIQPLLGYVSEQKRAGLRPKIRTELEKLLAGEVPGSTLVWAHNLALGRNLALSAELAGACGRRGIRLLAHQHDWWFDNRWQRWPEMRHHGFPNLASVGRALFPGCATLVHLAVNQEDFRSLRRHGMGAVEWLPNPMAPAPLPGKARCRKVRGWLSERIGGEAPVWLMACRLLRRKNVAEALLLTRWLRPEAILVTTGPVSSSQEKSYAQTLAAAARRQRWPLRLGILDGPGAPGVGELTAASEVVLSTSLQEGFGLPPLEAVAAGRPLIVRQLPNIQHDLAKFGFRFAQSYQEILIDPALFDLRAERRRQRQLFGKWRAQLPRVLRCGTRKPPLLEPNQPVPFSQLTLSAQLEVLAHSPEVSWKGCSPLNPFLKHWKKRAAAGALEPDRWPAKASCELSPEAYAERFARFLAQWPGMAEGGADHAGLLREALEKKPFPLLWDLEA